MMNVDSANNTDKNMMLAWEEKYVPWADRNYNLTDLHHYWKAYEDIEMIRNWASENLTGKFELTLGHGYFEFGEDSILFALRWM